MSRLLKHGRVWLIAALCLLATLHISAQSRQPWEEYLMQSGLIEDIENEDQRQQLMSMMDDESSEDIRLIKSFDSDEIGSIMTTNYVSIPEIDTIKEAMEQLRDK